MFILVHTAKHSYLVDCLWPLQITKKQCCWSGALRIGFTSKDPSRINPDSLPKYACPDLVSQSRFWAKALPEELSNEGNVISFWVDKKGRVFYRINDSSPMLFFSGVQVSEPLWALIDVYGLTRGIQLLGESCVRIVLISQKRWHWTNCSCYHYDFGRSPFFNENSSASDCGSKVMFHSAALLYPHPLK